MSCIVYFWLAIFRVIQENGGSPPLTYAMFCQVTDMIGLPPQPEGEPDFQGILLPVSEDHDKKYKLPTLEQLGKFCIL